MTQAILVLLSTVAALGTAQASMKESPEGALAAYTRTFTLDQAACTAQLAVRGAHTCIQVEAPAKPTDLLVVGTKAETATGPGVGPAGGCKIIVTTQVNGYTLEFGQGGSAGSDPQSCFREAIRGQVRPGQTPLLQIPLVSVIYRTP